MAVSKVAFWQMHIAAWRCSGDGQRAYCARNELSASNFRYWLRRLSHEPSTPALLPVLRVPALSPTSSAGVQLRSPGGWVISLPSPIEPSALQALLAALP